MKCPNCGDSNHTDVCDTKYDEYSKTTKVIYICDACGKEWIERLEHK